MAAKDLTDVVELMRARWPAIDALLEGAPGELSRELRRIWQRVRDR